METKEPKFWNSDCPGKSGMYVDLKYKRRGVKSDANDDPVKRKVCNSASSTPTGDKGFVTTLLSLLFQRGFFFLIKKKLSPMSVHFILFYFFLINTWIEN